MASNRAIADHPPLKFSSGQLAMPLVWCKQPVVTDRPVVQTMANYERDVSPEDMHSRRHLPSITLAESRPLAVVNIVIHLPISLLWC